MRTEIQEAVFDLIEKQLCVRREKIALEKSINIDLGMDGDDAVEFFEAFTKTFSVDLTQLGEEWDLYFGPEGSGFLFYSALVTLFSTRATGYLPLRIERIVQAAETKIWTKLTHDRDA